MQYQFSLNSQNSGSINSKHTNEEQKFSDCQNVEVEIVKPEEVSLEEIIHVQAPMSEHLEIPTALELQVAGLRFLYQLLKVGGWTVAVLLAFRLIIVSLLAAGSSPVALVLAISAGTFLVLCGIGAILKELLRK